MELELTNIVDISVSEAGAGAGDYNTSNIALFSRETPGGGFGSDGYKIYLSPKEVGTDFGTNSDTYGMANAIFSQQPNILAGNGYLVVIPFVDTGAVVAVQTVTPSLAPASGNYKLSYGAATTSSLAWDATAGQIQTALQLLAGLGSATVTGTLATHLTVTFTGVSGPAALLVPSVDSLQTATPVNVNLTVVTTVPGSIISTETLGAAVTRTEDLVQYFGIMAAEITGQVNMLAAAAVVQALNKISFFVSRDSAAVDSGGYLDLIRTGGFTKSRGLYYGAVTDFDTLVMMASYAGRGLSTNFSGSNTTQNMHLKDLHGVQPDPSMTQTLLDKAKIAGADVYASFQGVPKVFCSGANSFFDRVYNLEWFTGALQIAGFNFLAEASTKIPQTEAGISALKAAYRAVCEQGITNQYGAPGTWTSSTTFGNQVDFLANILQRGYYIYSVPVARQSPTDRAARMAPLVQIAFKEAGAVDSSSVIVNINA